jgi:extracellular factor (EF) 3-hydroxypalmitic acid methyl ester biosynthesis protein
LQRPVELVMLDQDADALHVCHQEINRQLKLRHRDRLPIRLSCLHFSIKQFLKPRDAAELQVVEKVLSGLDLVYSSGLFDYLPDPVAAAVLRKLYASLNSGGRLYIGNLKEAADTSWIMEFVLAWHLLYRTRESMTPLANGLSPAPAKAEVGEDETGHCLFLDVVRP